MLEAIQQYLKDERLDAFLVLTKINRQYLSGFTGSAGYLLVGRKNAALFVDGRYFLRAKKETKLPVKNVESLSRYLAHAKYKKIAIEDRISLREFAHLKKLKRGIAWKPTPNLIESLRMQKTKAELAAIEKGSRIIDRVFEKVVRGITPRLRSGQRGLTEAEVAYRIEKFGKSLGADGLAFDPIVAYGPNAAIPHHFSSNTKIGKNNFLLLDFGFKVNGYHSDFTRTLFIGRPNKLQIKVYETVLKAQLKALEAVELGQKAANVDAAARKLISKAGFGKYFTHNTGHGVGLEIHELPNFSPSSEDILENNSVVTVEPGIYLPHKFGVRIEDMVILAKKPRVLSQIPKDLKSMII